MTPRPRGLRRHRRRGAFTAEFLVTMPIFMIFLLAIVQFGVLFSNVQTVSLASRNAAEAASEEAVPPVSVPSSVIGAVTQQLGSSNIDYCRIRLEHNVGGGAPVAYLQTGPSACNCDPMAVLPPADRPAGEYVRVTVCVQAGDLMPNLLQVFGFNAKDPDRVVSYTTVMQYE